MSPPPLRPKPDPTKPDAPPKPVKSRFDQCVEIIAESKAGDYMAAIAAGLKAFREARRLRDGKEVSKEPEERDI